VGRHSGRLRLALVVLGAFAAIAVTGASAADFEIDEGPCRETPREALLLLCPTAYVGVEYEVQLESEDGSGCEPYDWFEVANGALPEGLTLSRDGVISGVPTGAGVSRFWVWNHDLIAAEGGPSWCQREDRSEKEFTIPVDPGLAIDNATLAPATIGQPYSQTLTATHLATLNPPAGTPVAATWSVQSGALPPGVTLSTAGELTGTPTAEGSYHVVIAAQTGGPPVAKEYALSVRQPLVVTSPFAPTPRPAAEVGVRLTKTLTASGGSGTYTWSVTSGALPAGIALDASNGTVSGVPQAAGTYTFVVTATDTEGRAATVDSTLGVASKLAISSARLKPGKVGRAYRAKIGSSGGVRPLAWKVVGGKLPSGLRFVKRLGAVQGTPRQAGTFNLTVEAKDALGAKAKKKLVLRVAG
jgi:hypothetical protein